MTDLQVREGTVANMPEPANPLLMPSPRCLRRSTIPVGCSSRVAQINKLIRNGRLESVCIGRRRFVKRRSIFRLVGEVE
jgi:hypothetical protein